VAAPHRSWSRDGYTIDTDPARLDLGVVHGFLAASYWAEGIPRDVVERSVAGSLNFGLYRDGAAAVAGEQAGFARVVTDRATFAYLADVFVLEAHRGRGLSKWLMECVTAHPDLQGLRRWVLLTRDAHGLYRRYGFADVANPERWMHRWDPQVYTRPAPER
jgi:GNAT superfamily N-acetyltransferase